MMIQWNEQSTEWFERASDYTGYNRKMAELILAHIPVPTTLCDLGCGAGLLDFLLAPHFEKLTCVDILPEAVSLAARGAAKRGLRNIKTVCADSGALEGRWGCVLATFHGGEDFFEKFYPMAEDRLIFVTHAAQEGNLGPKGKRVNHCFDAKSAAAVLQEAGVRFTVENHSLEYGQPLKNMEEAERFVSTYALPMTAEERTAYLEAQLQPTGDAQFPLYLPKKRDFAMFVIRRDENGTDQV